MFCSCLSHLDYPEFLQASGTREEWHCECSSIAHFLNRAPHASQGDDCGRGRLARIFVRNPGGCEDYNRNWAKRIRISFNLTLRGNLLKIKLFLALAIGLLLTSCQSFVEQPTENKGTRLIREAVDSCWLFEEASDRREKAELRKKADEAAELAFDHLLGPKYNSRNTAWEELTTAWKDCKKLEDLYRGVSYFFEETEQTEQGQPKQEFVND